MTLKLANLVALVGTVITRAVPLTWIEGKHAWPVMFCLFALLLILWYLDRYIEQRIITPIREATAAITKLQESTRGALSELELAAKSLTCTVGNQHNRVEALTAQIAGNHEYIYKSLTELLKRIPPLPPKT